MNSGTDDSDLEGDRDRIRRGMKGRAGGRRGVNGKTDSRSRRRAGNGGNAIWEEENEDSPARDRRGGMNRKRNGHRGTAGSSVRGTANTGVSRTGRRRKGTKKSTKSSLPPRKWRDTRKVSYLGARKADDRALSRERTFEQFDPRNSARRGDLYKLDRDDYLSSLMNRYGPDLKKKEKAKKKRRAASRGIPSGARQVSYFDHAGTNRRRRRHSNATSNLSEDPDGTWSNAKMLRYFVKEAV